ncbi:MAG: hypothetical protein M1436_03920 [Acidobacteria bacterium]|nr:hypothetical protein [Acidobacteriota bacterium]
MKINSDFRDLLERFIAAQVKFLVVGGYAVIKYTEPYYTKDLDIWIEPDPENASRTLAALKAFGAPVADVRVEDLLNSDLVYQVGVEPVRVDVMSAIPGLSFADTWAHHDTADFDGLPVPILSLPDIIAAKKASSRPKDRIQIRQLEMALLRAGTRSPSQ